MKWMYKIMTIHRRKTKMKKGIIWRDETDKNNARK